MSRADPHSFTWFLDITGDGDAGDTGEMFAFGISGDKPLVGDWNATGVDTWGVFRNGTWYLDKFSGDQIADFVFAYGLAGDKPLVGDWNGSGTGTWGVFRDGRWYLDHDGDRIADEDFSFGIPGDKPVVGDFNGDGTDTWGVFRDGRWYLDSTGNYTADMVFSFGIPDDEPLVGNWSGTGPDTWGVFRDGRWYLDSNGDRVADTTFTFGLSTDTPLAGNWGDGSATPLSVPVESTNWYVMCFPNPASTGDGVTFRMMGAGVNAVQVSVYDLGGGLVYQSAFETGRSLTWDLYSEGAPVANGIYLYSMIAKAYGELIETEIGKLLILR